MRRLIERINRDNNMDINKDITYNKYNKREDQYLHKHN